ncbi:MAG: ParA family protein [Flavobacteriales bacterium]
MTKIFSVANQKGGVGKTTLTAMLACALAVNEKKKVLVLDCDNQRSISRLREVEGEYFDIPPPFDIIAVSPEKVMSNLENYSKYDIVFIDIPRFTTIKNDSGAMKMLYLCDAVLVPFLVGVMDYLSTKSFVNALNNLSKQKHKEDFYFYGVLNKSRRLKMEKETIIGLQNVGLSVFENKLSLLNIFNDYSTYETMLKTKLGRKRFEAFYQEFLQKFKLK